MVCDTEYIAYGDNTVTVNAAASYEAVNDTTGEVETATDYHHPGRMAGWHVAGGPELDDFGKRLPERRVWKSVTHRMAAVGRMQVSTLHDIRIFTIKKISGRVLRSAAYFMSL